MDLDFKNPYSRKDKKFKPTPFIGPSSKLKKNDYVSHYADKARIVSVVIAVLGLYIYYFLLQTVFFLIYPQSSCIRSYHWITSYFAFYCNKDQHPFESAFLRFLEFGLGFLLFAAFQVIIIRLQAKYKKPLPRWLTILFFLVTPIIFLLFLYIGYRLVT